MRRGALRPPDAHVVHRALEVFVVGRCNIRVGPADHDGGNPGLKHQGVLEVDGQEILSSVGCRHRGTVDE